MASLSPPSAYSVMTGFVERRRIETDEGEIRFEATERTREMTIEPNADINWLSAEQSNSSLIVGGVAMLKIFRRIAGGPHPEAEMSRHLTDPALQTYPRCLA